MNERGLPLADAARALGERPGTLRRWVREGCPVVRRGHRGRGSATLVDPSEVQTWRQANTTDAVVLEIAAGLLNVTAIATDNALKKIEGIDKRRMGGILAAVWYETTTATLDYLRTKCTAVPEIEQLPRPIERLREIALK
jgi:transposase-like protein